MAIVPRGSRRDDPASARGGGLTRLLLVSLSGLILAYVFRNLFSRPAPAGGAVVPTPATAESAAALGGAAVLPRPAAVVPLDPPRLAGEEAASAAWRLSWVTLLSVLLAVIMLIPIRRYGLPGGLPFELEPYRLVVVALLGGWVAALLVDPRVRIRPTGLGGPLALLAVAALASLLANQDRVLSTQSEVVKSLSYLASFLLVTIVIASVVENLEQIERLLKVLVGTGAVVAVFSIMEAVTGFNVFNHLQSVMPFMRLEDIPLTPGRGGRLRVFGSAQHSIALSAVMILLIPIAGYLAMVTRRWWWPVTAVLLGIAAVATLARTGIIMLMTLGLVLLILRPALVKRALPWILPALVVTSLLMPGAIGAFRTAFFPEGGLLQEQRAEAGKTGSGRVADLGPALAEWRESPVVGYGYGTRVTTGDQSNAFILDNQWLSTLLEVGALGVIAWLWLIGRAVRRLGRVAREDRGPPGLLAACITASISAFAVGAFTYDAFAFVQVTFVFFVLVAFGAVLVREHAAASAEDRPEREPAAA